MIKLRCWILASGLLILLLAPVLSGPGTDVRSFLVVVGFVLVFCATLGVLLAIPMALRARREFIDLPIRADLRDWAGPT